MKYLILISHNEQAREVWQGMSDTERQLGVGAHAALVEELAAAGELIASEALADPATARRVRVDRGRTIATDGPFPEVKEYLAGFYLVKCDSIEQAVAHAARVPEARLGLVEVRPVLVADRPDV
ncbi:YciI family protein [Micromonospora sp. NPDC051925]|uniref:YciI family protein n=1 Tax=Micromonospora sp. NPDC051925 TaxID=3364288 RepID=UPI0037CBA96B